MLINEGLRGKLYWLAAVLLLLLLAGAFPRSAWMNATVNASTSTAAGTEQTFDCSLLNELGIAKQLNFHAMQIMAACEGGKLQLPRQQAPDPAKEAANIPGAKVKNNLGKLLNPLNYGGADVDIILPDNPQNYNTQSESFVWGNGNTIVSAYNDIRGTSSFCAGAVSYSTDGGVTWTRPGGSGNSPMCSGHDHNFGDPTVIYNVQNGLWYASFLASGCGGQGIGLWTSPDGVTWSAGVCAHNGTQDDRQSHWVDNNPSSPYYGRQYISWNNLAAGQNIYVVYSDNGTTWSTPVRAQTGGFIRNVQLTGSPGSDGTVFIAGMNEGGGAANNRTNLMYRSTDGGASWSATTLGTSFPPPGDVVCPSSAYFYNVAPYMRHMGWGQPAVGPANTVHYVYARRGTDATDHGDIYYTRSTDNGVTWSTDVRLNTDTTTREQWMPSLSATGAGAVFASWYDRRDTSGNDFEYWGRKSLDGGVTWQPDEAISDVVSSFPPAPPFNACYAGDYMYASADSNVNQSYVTWMYGLIPANGQDTYFDKENVSVGTPTPTNTPCSPVPCTNTPTNAPTRTRTSTSTASPTATVCGNYSYATATGTIVPGTVDTGNHGDDVVTNITLPFPVQFYNTLTFTSANVSSNGNLQFVTTNTAYVNNCLPDTTMGPAIMAHWDDLMTDAQTNCSRYPGGTCGIFTSVSGTAPNRIFNIEWRAVYFFNGPAVSFEVRLYEGQRDFDVILGQLDQGGASATIGVQDIAAIRFTQFECNVTAPNNTRIAFTFGGCGPTATATRPGTPCGSCPTITRTHTPTVPPTLTYTSTPTCTGPGVWSTVTPLSSPVLDNAVASLGGYLYSFSGVSAGAVVPNSYRYDPVADTWTEIAPLPSAREQASAVSDGAYIYILGGADSTGAITNTNYRYDPSTNAYILMAPFIQPSWAQAAAYEDGYIYKIAGCGLNCGSFQNTVERYDVSSNSWAFVTSYPQPLGWLMAVGYNGYVYAAGGISTSVSNKAYRYDPVSATWDDNAAPDLPVGRWGSASGLLNGRWILTGGYVPNVVSNTVMAYNFGTGAWDTLPNLLVPRARFGGASLDGSLYAVGGHAPPRPGDGLIVRGDTFRYNEQKCATPTASLTPTVTATGMPTGTASPTPTSTVTPTSAWTVTPPATTTLTPTPCAVGFSDVRLSDYFYTAVIYLACHGVISGYADGTFRPYNDTTRGQLCKIVVLAEGWQVQCPSTGHFSDVLPSNPFFCYIETAYLRNVISGYADGTFRPGNNVTRAQLCKIVVLAEGWTLDCPPPGHFSDVPPSHTFFCYIETAYNHGIISGYDDGTFRPGNPATRGQIAKIVYEAILPPFSPWQFRNCLLTRALHGVIVGID